ncbi:MAG: hypothetical protein ABSA83_01495 [Verrucomicrobiota bacterium]|jgi:hypothetical protein
MKRVNEKRQVKTRNYKDKNMKIKIAISMLSAAICALAVQQAQATSITGEVNFNGTATLNTTSLTSATEITAFGTTTVASGTGTYSILGPTYGQTVTWATPLLFATGAQVHTPLWSFSGAGDTFAFNLASITSYTVIGGNTTAELMGLGTLTDSAAGFTATPGNFTLTITDSSGGNSGQATFGFAASNTGAGGVPDGGLTVALLGGAMTAMVLARSKLGKLK